MTATLTAGAAAHPDPSLAAMGFVDISGDQSISLYLDMVHRISVATQPQQVMDAYSNAVRRFSGPMGLLTISCLGLKPGQYRITRQIGLDNVNLVNTNNPWQQREKLPVRSGGFLGAVAADTQPKLCRRLHVPHDPVLGDWLAQFGSCVAIPNYHEGVPTHWAVILRPQPDAFTTEDLADHLMRSNLIGTTINHVITGQQLRAANAKLQEEVERIANIQRALLPRYLPKITGLSIAASYETYDTAGGDMYDFACSTQRDHPGKVDPDAPWGIMVADVSGHGPAAATIAAMLNAILYAFPKTPDSPGEVLAYANRHLCAKRIEHSFVTALLAMYDPLTRKLTYSRAGHPPAIIKSKGQPLIRLDDPGSIPLGVIDDAVFLDGAVTLEPGQTLVMYTDGITESMNRQRQMFGIEGIERSLEHCSGEPACVIESIHKALRLHEAGAQPSDDQTIVALKVVE
jgi:sigma-B regulation protein RsbU (phosphoserine phosphatase)